MHQSRKMEHQISYFPNWNLQMLDLENIDEPDCINTLNEFFFANYFRGYRTYLTFTSVMNELEKMGGLYGF